MYILTALIVPEYVVGTVEPGIKMTVTTASLYMLLLFFHTLGVDDNWSKLQK